MPYSQYSPLDGAGGGFVLSKLRVSLLAPSLSPATQLCSALTQSLMNINSGYLHALLSPHSTDDKRSLNITDDDRCYLTTVSLTHQLHHLMFGNKLSSLFVSR